MTDKELFKIWAPTNIRWTDWVRPVYFIDIHSVPNITFTLEPLHTLDTLHQDTAIIIDLPGADGVLTGLAYAKLGYRPIPLYNGTEPQTGAKSLVNNTPIKSALLWGTTALQTLSIHPDAPPVFLLDSNRIFRYKMNPSLYDNSWDIYDQDMPSSDYLLSHGIRNIIVHSEKVQRDLTKILYKFQKKGLNILTTQGFATPQKITIKKPPKKDKFH